MENKEYKNLGCMNGWREYPVEYKECRAKGHAHVRTPHSSWRCYNYYRCEICKIKYEVDSSD